MRARFAPSLLVAIGVLAGASTWVDTAVAQAKPNPAARAAKPSKPQRPAKPKKGAPEKAAEAAPEPEAVEAEAPARSTGEGESGVKSAGTDAKDKDKEKAAPVKETTSAEGVKRYDFGVIEVEGRLRSPQIIYFLRRVRAEFDAGALGHRSFLRELSDTRRDAAFR